MTTDIANSAGDKAATPTCPDLPPALAALRFDHAFTDSLPADPDTRNHPRQVLDACYSWVRPLSFPKATLLAWSEAMAQALDLDPETCRSPAFTAVFSGTQPLPAMKPHACCYGGHQFGHWAGQLGDGRAINLGEVVAADGRHWVLQLKGAGPTPYSRTADGLAVLRSSLREFVCSEAMHHLGIPTTRALSLITTGETVVRDMFYDGNPQPEPGAVVCRVAPSFTRFGSFEIFAHRGQHDLLRKLADYTITHDFPHLVPPQGKAMDAAVYLRWFQEVCERTATMILHWMRVGFVHGVMNTDNMSILGLTIDYGPYGWLENYDPNWTPNTTDAQGRRYRFGQQPQVALWNLVQLANALYPLIEDVPALENTLESFKQDYDSNYRAMMAAKLGLLEFDAASDESLLQELRELLEQGQVDMTLFFRRLADSEPLPETASAESLLAPVAESFYEPPLAPAMRDRMAAWMRRYHQRLLRDALPQTQRQANMDAVNPRYVPRNWLLQEAIDQASEGDLALLHELMTVLKQPYHDQPGKDHLDRKRPEWARHKAGCSMLSCSS